MHAQQKEQYAANEKNGISENCKSIPAIALTLLFTRVYLLIISLMWCALKTVRLETKICTLLSLLI